MIFQEILCAVQKLRCAEKRAQTERYLEVVIPQEILSQLKDLLAAYFGLPLKADGQPSSAAANSLSKPYGGIQKNQTLYFRENETIHEMALLWPWASGAFTTVKLIQEKVE